MQKKYMLGYEGPTCIDKSEALVAVFSKCKTKNRLLHKRAKQHRSTKDIRTPSVPRPEEKSGTMCYRESTENKTNPCFLSTHNSCRAGGRHSTQGQTEG